MANKDKRMGWHLLNSRGKLGFTDNRTVSVGNPLSIPSELHVILCESGMHACDDILSCMYSSARGRIFCRVLVESDIEVNRKGAINKFAGRTRTVLKWTDASEFDNIIDEFTSYMLGIARTLPCDIEYLLPRAISTIELKQSRIDNYNVYMLCHAVAYNMNRRRNYAYYDFLMKQYSRKLSEIVIKRLHR